MDFARKLATGFAGLHVSAFFCCFLHSVISVDCLELSVWGADTAVVPL